MFKNPLWFFWFYTEEAKAEGLNNLPKIPTQITVELEFYPRPSDYHCHDKRLFFPKLGDKGGKGKQNVLSCYYMTGIHCILNSETLKE